MAAAIAAFHVAGVQSQTAGGFPARSVRIVVPVTPGGNNDLAVRSPGLHKRFLELGVELTASASPDDFTAHIKAEFEKKGKLAREAGIKME